MSQNIKISIKKSPELSNSFPTSNSSPSLLAYPLILLIKIYQLTLSPLFSGSCRFEPSCSNYAIGAFTRHGAIKGFWLSLKRLGKCHPWHPGGYDPVA